MDLVEILSFLFQLSFSTLGKVSRGMELGAWVGKLVDREMRRGNQVMGKSGKDKNEQSRDGKRRNACMRLGGGECDVLDPTGHLSSPGLFCGRYE